MSTTKALVLFAHGARDPRWSAPFERLQQVIQAQLPEVAVRLAFLELMNPRLPEVAAELVQAGCSKLMIVPVFLGQGGHVLRDLPEIVAQLQADHPQVEIRVADAVGESTAVLDAMAQYCVGTVAG